MYLTALGAALIGEQKPEEARNYLVRAIQLHPDSPQAVSNLANALTKMNRHSEALELLQTYIRTYPNSSYRAIIQRKADEIQNYIRENSSDN